MNSAVCPCKIRAPSSWTTAKILDFHDPILLCLKIADPDESEVIKGLLAFTTRSIEDWDILLSLKLWKPLAGYYEIAGWPSFEDKLPHLLFIRRCVCGVRTITCLLSDSTA